VVRVNGRGVRLDDDDVVYIGRPSKWGNPFVIGRDGTRGQVIEKYENHLLNDWQLVEALPELQGKRLACYCAPKPCHGDLLAWLADHLADASRTFHFSWPASWWQRWKIDHPRCARFLTPVRYIKAQANVEVASWATYPEATLITPELGKPYIIQEVRALSSLDGYEVDR
jgi:hypothetical protein